MCIVTFFYFINCIIHKYFHMLLILKLSKLQIDTLKIHFDIFASHYYDYCIKKL